MAGVVYNKFKYNNITDVNLNCCIRKKDSFYDIGVSKTFDYGPTSITGFWNGVSIPSGALASFQNKISQGPSIYITNTSADFVNYANNLGIGTFTGTSQALSYIASAQTDIVVTNINYPEIETVGLRFLYDAGFSASYPWQDDVWYDISSQHQNGVLSGGTIWSTGGTDYASSYMLFNKNAQSQFAVMPGFLSQVNNFTLQIWVNFNSISLSDEVNIVSQVPVGYTNSNYFITLDTSGRVIGGFKLANVVTSVIIDSSPTTNNWTLYSLTFDGVELKGYVNDQPTNSAAITTTLQTSSQPVIIGGTTNYSINNGANNYFDGKIGVVLLYDIAHNLSLIESNYNVYNNSRY
jgi:hypothetical protein